MRSRCSNRLQCAAAAPKPSTESTPQKALYKSSELPMAAIPELDTDLYSDDTLANTNARYRAMRDRAPIVYLPANGMYAVTRYDAIRDALRSDEVLISGRGVGGNSLVNDDRTPTEITLSSDGD